MNLPALMRGESSRLRRDTLDLAGCRQSRTRPRPWPARYRAGIASIPVLTHGVLFRDKIAPMSQRAVPRFVVWLGYAGLAPFVASTVAFLIAPPRLHGFVLYSLLTYSAVILSFLGAIHWGLAMRDEGVSSRVQLGLSVVPALVGWVALALSPTMSFVVLIVAFVVLYTADTCAARFGLTPTWYPRLRLPLTVVVVLSLIMSAILV